MKLVCRLLGLLALAAQGMVAAGGDEPPPRLDPAARVKHERLLEIYREDAAGYTIYRDAGRTEKVELRTDPVYVWTNPLVGKGQDGAVFVWTCRGRAEVIGCVFSSPATGPKVLTHELHSLATTVLDVTHEGSDREWKPQAPGITLSPIAGAPSPAPSPGRRLAQMRALTNELSAHTEDPKGQQWQLRLLPQPLYRYESTDPDVLDGALFSFVSSAGTDPEILLVIEARRGPGGTDPTWRYALARFSFHSLAVRHKGEEIWTAPLVSFRESRKDPQDRYACFKNRVIPALEEEAP
jgi:hypothetical protein